MKLIPSVTGNTNANNIKLSVVPSQVLQTNVFIGERQTCPNYRIAVTKELSKRLHSCPKC